MKTEEEILLEHKSHGFFKREGGGIEKAYLKEEILSAMQQYSDQNTKQLIECLKEVKRIEGLNLFNESEKLEAIKQAVDLTLSQYDKENDCG